MRKDVTAAIIMSAVLVVTFLFSCTKENPVIPDDSVDRYRSVIEGVVVDRRGDPLSGVVVASYSDGVSVTTNRSGQYRLTGIRAGENEVVFFRDDYLDTSINVKAGLSDNKKIDTVGLQYRFSEVRGRVLDQMGNPIDGLTGVAVEGQSAPAVVAIMGRYEIPRLQPGKLRLVSLHDGYGFGFTDKEIVNDSTYTDIDIQLQGAGGEVFGTVVADCPEGDTLIRVSKAEITLFGGLYSASSDDTGYFSIKNVPSHDVVSVTVKKADFDTEDTLVAVLGGLRVFEKWHLDLGTVKLQSAGTDTSGIFSISAARYQSELKGDMVIEVVAPVRLTRGDDYLAFRYEWDLTGDGETDTTTATDRLVISRLDDWETEGDYMVSCRMLVASRTDGTIRGSGTAYITISLEDRAVPPLFNTLKQTQVTVPMGESLRLALNVSQGTVPLLYSWYLKMPEGEGTVLLQQSGSDADSTTLMIDSVPREYDRAQVFGIVSNSRGTDTSVTISLTVEVDTFVVSFDSRGEDEIPIQKVADGLLATTPPTPERENYSFEGWYSDTVGGVLWDFDSSVVTGDMTLYAQWREEVTGRGEWTETENSLTDPDGNTYTTVNIGTQVWTVENLRTTKYRDGTPIPHVESGSDWFSLSTPAYCWYSDSSEAPLRNKYGALYNWWVVDPSNSKNIAPEGWRVPTDEDWTVLEKFLIANGYNWDKTTEENKIGKSLASNGSEWDTYSLEGTIGNNQENNNRSGFSALPAGYRSNSGDYSLLGQRSFWWSSSEANTSDSYHRILYEYREDFRRLPLFKGHGLSVRLLREQPAAELYTIIFEPNGGTGTMDPLSPATGDTVNLIENTFIFEGHTFTGWNTAIGGEGDTYDDQAAFTAGTGNDTLYAQWSINEYTLTFVSNHGSAVDPITQDYGTDITAPQDPTSAGYTFDRWDPVVPATMPAENVTITAQWVADSNTVTFHPNGGQGRMNPQVVATGDTVNLIENTFIFEGHTFTGWNTAIGGEGEPYADGADFVIGIENVVLYAQWELSEYTVTFDPNGGDPIDTAFATKSVIYGEPYGQLMPVLPSRVGNLFNGWFTATTGGDEITSDSIVQIPDAHKLYAQWRPITFPAVVADFETGGIQNKFGYWHYTFTDSTTRTSGQPSTATPFAKGPGYQSDSAGYMAFTFGDTWRPPNSMVPQQPFVALGTQLSPEGGYVDLQDIQSISFAIRGNDSFTVRLDVMLEDGYVRDAAWHSALFSVSSSWREVTINISELQQPQWIMEPTPFNPQRMNRLHWLVGQDHNPSLSAGELWVDNVVLNNTEGAVAQYTVNFQSNEGSPVDPLTITAGGLIPKPSDPTRLNYNFGGWHSDTGLTTGWDFNSDFVSRDMTLYARWEEVLTGTGEWIIEDDRLMDPDGNIYTTVTIGSQVWTVENLRTTRYTDGTSVPNVTGDTEWAALSTPAFSWHNSDPQQGYGALYNWWVVDPDNEKDIAPDGWRVPTDTDWTALTDSLGGRLEAGGKMKTTGTSEWESPNQGATNESGFSALPGGNRITSGGYVNTGTIGRWWSATSYMDTEAFGRYLFSNAEHIERNVGNKRSGFSVRLVRDVE